MKKKKKRSHHKKVHIITKIKPELVEALGVSQVHIEEELHVVAAVPKSVWERFMAWLEGSS